MGLDDPTSISISNSPQPRLHFFFFEAILSGLLIGISQTIAETALMAWFGLKTSIFDILLYLSFYVVLGVFLSLFLYGTILVIQILPWNKVKTGLHTREWRNLFFLFATIFGYCLFGSLLLSRRISGFVLYISLALLITTSVILLKLMFSCRHSLAALALSLLTISFTATAVTLAAIVWYDVSQMPLRFRLCIGLSIPAILGLVLLMFVNKSQDTVVSEVIV